MAMTDYIAFEQASQPPNMPSMGMSPEPLVSDVPAVIPPAPPPLAPRLPANRLLDMYRAWEQAK